MTSKFPPSLPPTRPVSLGTMAQRQRQRQWQGRGWHVMWSGVK